MNYRELEELQRNHKKKVCIFGAGYIGRTWGYDIVTSVGFSVDFYYDNKIEENVEIRDGIKTVNFNWLCQNKNEVLVFVTITERLHQTIEKQLKEGGITNYIMMGVGTLHEFCESVLNSNEHSVKQKYKDIVEDQEFIKRIFRYRLGYELNLEKPQTFNEKLQWLKLHDRKPFYTNFVDKCEFKKIIEKEIGKEYVIPTLKVWDKVEDIKLDELPNQFVLKCTHDSGSVIICRDKSEFDITIAKQKLLSSMKRNYYWYGREWPYKNVKPRVIAEKYMENKGKDSLKDYKVFCFNGVPKIILTVEGGHEDENKVIRRIYDTDWQRIKVGIHGKEYEETSEKKPEQLEEVITIASKLSKGIPHIRVDFYIIDGKIYLGELTLYHMSGMENFKPAVYDKIFGEFLELN